MSDCNYLKNKYVMDNKWLLKDEDKYVPGGNW
jgi:hypothetical protein